MPFVGGATTRTVAGLATGPTLPPRERPYTAMGDCGAPLAATSTKLLLVEPSALRLPVRKLERDGLVQRTAYPEVPPRVEYALTPLGTSFIEPAMGVTQWALGADEEIRRNRAAFDRA